MTCKEYKACDVREHVLESGQVGGKFRIKVVEPIRRSDGTERFPVVYATDSDEFFGGMANIAKELQLVGEAPRFVLVAIGYEDERDADLLRMRDLFSSSMRAHFQRTIELLAHSPLATGRYRVEDITSSTDAGHFSSFIRQELMPFINERYPVRANDSCYYGYSAGGTFGIYTLFTQPETFRRYILGSPALSYDGHHFGIEHAAAFIESGRKLQAEVFMSAGELEEFYGKFDLVTGYYLMAKYLKSAALPDLALKLRVFPEETHATSWTRAFSQGLKSLFGPACETPWWPNF